MDYKAILEVCEKATRWKTVEDWALLDNNGDLLGTTKKEVIDFIALARTALPELVERCIALENVAEDLLNTSKRSRCGFPLEFEEWILVEEMAEIALAELEKSEER